MGGHKPQNVSHRPRKEAHQVKLNHMLDFGPEQHPHNEPKQGSNEITDRLNQLVKKLQELNQRVDALNHKY